MAPPATHSNVDDGISIEILEITVLSRLDRRLGVRYDYSHNGRQPVDDRMSLKAVLKQTGLTGH